MLLIILEADFLCTSFKFILSCLEKLSKKVVLLYSVRKCVQNSEEMIDLESQPKSYKQFIRPRTFLHMRACYLLPDCLCIFHEQITNNNAREKTSISEMVFLLQLIKILYKKRKPYR
jgi:hypothetical protein